MQKTTSLLIPLLLFPSLLFANGVGSSMNEVIGTVFAERYLIDEVSAKKIELGRTLKHYKPGGDFREFVDLYLTVDQTDTLVGAKLVVSCDRSAKFGTMITRLIIRSFIADLAANADRKVCQDLSMRIYLGKGVVDKKLAHFVTTIERGGNATAVLDQCVLTCHGDAASIVIAFHPKGWVHAKAPEDGFLGEEYMAGLGMTLVRTVPDMKMWMPKEKGKGNFTSIMDGRRFFETEIGALNYYNAFQIQQSEGGERVADFDKKLGNRLNVYYLDKENSKMMAIFGLEDTQYNFLFQKGTCFVKVYVTAKKGVGIEEAFKVAQEAAKGLKATTTPAPAAK